MGAKSFGHISTKESCMSGNYYSPFLFSLGPIHGQNKGEINFLTFANDRRIRSTLKGIHSSSVIIKFLYNTVDASLFVKYLITSFANVITVSYLTIS